jgi:imidazolonepropionase-like amidohydrolase
LSAVKTRWQPSARGTSLSAQSLNLGDKTGTLALGREADIIEVDGDPLKDIAAPARCFRHEWWESP